MKILLGAVLAASLIVIGYYAFKTCKEKHQLARTVSRILFIEFAIVLFNMVALFTASKRIGLFAYSIYFMAADWLLYYMFRFTIEYIGNEFEHHVKKNAMILLLSADSVSVLLNSVLGHLFDLKAVKCFGDFSVYQIDTTPFFYVHYAIIIMLVTFCLITFYYRAFTAPSFYRKKYLIMALILTAIVAANVVSTFRELIDLSIIGYVFVAMCIYYCAFVYTPQRLLSQTLFRVAQDMAVALIVMDTDGKKIYNNKYANSLLNADKPLLNKEGICLEEWCRNRYLSYSEEFTLEQSFFRGEEELILKIQLQIMLDEHAQRNGGYFVIQDRTEEINNLKKEKYLATHDKLTGLYNNAYFCEKAERYIKANTDTELLMICTDIKDFKMINDFFGTIVGDSVLVNFANMLKEHINGAIVYGRLGNDIFGILMEKSKYDETQFKRGDKNAFSSCMDKNVSFPMITYTGIYEIIDRTLPVSVMCDRARMAITTIKGDYHKRVAYYGEELRDNILHEQEMIRDLDRAISDEQFKIFLQPQMSSDGKLLGAEALVRWFHPVKGAIKPNDFIPIFEKNGLVSDVDKYIWEAACKLLRKWKDEGKSELYVSVNISPKDFYFLNIYKVFVELVKKYDIDPQNLKLEITETAIVLDFKRQLELIARLRRNGFIVEMDDFGSGYSSLNMLKDIHVDVLKIDMAFLKKAKDEERSKKILQMIISLSKKLGMPVITEGVETAEQLEFLTEMGCDMFQGYYFAKPMPVEEFEKKYF